MVGLRTGFSIVAIVIAVMSLFSLGAMSGKHVTEKKYQKMLQIQKDMVDEHRKKLVIKEREYAKDIRTYEDNIRRITEELETELATVTSSYDERMRSLQARSDYYYKLSLSGGDRCKELAEVTDAFDRNLERGIRVVERLSRAAEAVNRQNSQTIGIILRDRGLLND